jgi:CRISPR-associated protein Csd2
MFEHDRSAARGEMVTRGLYVFRHDSQLGNAHAHKLLDRIAVKPANGETAPRAFSDYSVLVDGKDMAAGASERVGGVTLSRLC